MAKLQNKGFTNYFGKSPVPVQILTYDNNKYAKVRLPSGEETDIKTGYIFADEALTRNLARIHWFVLGGGKRKDFQPRRRKTLYELSVPSGTTRQRLEFDSKADAVRCGVRHARALGHEVEVRAMVRLGRGAALGLVYVVCTPAGDAVQFNVHKRRRAGSYLRGFGKRMGRH